MFLLGKSHEKQSQIKQTNSSNNKKSLLRGDLFLEPGPQVQCSFILGVWEFTVSTGLILLINNSC